MSEQRRASYLPPGYEEDRLSEPGFVRLILPNGNASRDVLVSADTHPGVLSEIAWERHLDSEEAVCGCEGALGRPHTRPSLWSWVEHHLRPMYRAEELEEKMREFSEMHLLDAMELLDCSGHVGGSDPSDEDVDGMRWAV